MAAKKRTTPARRTGRAPAKKTTTRRKTSTRGMFSDAMKMLPYFGLRYITDLSRANSFLPWSDITIPLISWFINTKRELMPGMRDASVFLLAGALYDRFMGQPSTTTSGIPDTRPSDIDALIAATGLNKSFAVGRPVTRYGRDMMPQQSSPEYSMGLGEFKID